MGKVRESGGSQGPNLTFDLKTLPCHFQVKGQFRTSENFASPEQGKQKLSGRTVAPLSCYSRVLSLAAIA